MKLLLALLAFPLWSQTVAIRGETVFTAAGPSIEDGLIIVVDGKIQSVGPFQESSVPAGVQIFEAKFVTPGLIDAHTVVGLAGYLNQDHDQDQLEKSKPIQPELRAIDAYNTREPLVAWLKNHGITTIHTGHGPGALISGQTMLVKTTGDTVDDALVSPATMLAVTLAGSAKGSKGHPGTTAKLIAELRTVLIEAQAYQKSLKPKETKKSKQDKLKPVSRDLGKETLVKVLEGELPLLITADRERDILNALRLANEFKIRIVLDSVAEGYLVLDQIKAAEVPVILHPAMKRSYGEAENLTMESAKLFQDVGIPFAFQSGYEGYVPKTRVVLFEAAIAARYGLGRDGALLACTISAAKVLGVEDRIGSLEVGKDADIACFTGDPLEYTTKVSHVFIDGNLVSQEAR